MGALAPRQRLSASRKRDVVLRLLRGESLETVSREVGVELYRLEAWQARPLAGLELGLKEQAGEIRALPLPDSSRATLHGAVEKNVEPRSAIYTDEAVVYGGLTRYKSRNCAVHRWPGRHQHQWRRIIPGIAETGVHRDASLVERQAPALLHLRVRLPAQQRHGIG